MAQTTTTVLSYTVVPTVPAGEITHVVDDAILVGVWSTPIEVDTTSTFTATPGSGGSIIVQLSFDSGVTWRDVQSLPFSASVTSGVSPNATYIRATAIAATATLTVDTPVPATFSVGEVAPTVATEVQAEQPDEALLSDTAMITPLALRRGQMAKVASAAALETLRAGSDLSPEAWYYLVDSGKIYVASAVDTVRLVFDPALPVMHGSFADLPTLLLLTGMVEHDQAIVETLVGDATNVVMTYDGTYWRPSRPVLWECWRDQAGTTSASEQCAAAWTEVLPAYLLAGIRFIRLYIGMSKSGTTDILGTVKFYLGTDSTFNSNAAIVTVGGNNIAAASTFRHCQQHWEVTDKSATSAIRLLQTAGGGGQGMFTGDSGTTSPASPVAVSLDSGDGVNDILRLFMSVAMNGTTDTPSTSLWMEIIP